MTWSYIAGLFAALNAVSTLHAQTDEAESGAAAEKGVPVLSKVPLLAASFSFQDERPDPQTREELVQRMIEAKDSGLWEKDTNIREQATDHFFQQHGWTSEPDLFAREVLREVETVPPWDQHKRQEIFINSLGRRFDLSQSQKELLDKSIQSEGMAISRRHFKETLPIVLEVIKTRAGGKPFTPEQVAKWSKTLEPMLEEARQAVDRVTKKLSETMTPAQRERLERDLAALMKRHGDVVKAMHKWKQGKWDPTDWGLQNDPVHAGLVADIRTQEAWRLAELEGKLAKEKDLKSRINARNEDEWERYVRLFCLKYGCDDRQIKSAYGALADVKKQAASYRQSRGKDIDAVIAQIEDAADAKAREPLVAKRDKLLEPIGKLFEQLCQRLDAQVLNSEQRARFKDEAKPAAATKK